MVKTKLFDLNYPVDLMKNYQQLAKLPGFVLLESNDKLAGRYDILSAFPYEQLIIERNTRSVSQIFKQLEHLIPQATSVHNLPFQGGAIGYFSYDLAAQLAGIDISVQENLQNIPLVNMGLYDWAIITDHYLKKVTLLAANTQAQTMELVDKVLSEWEKADSRFDSFRLIDAFSPLITQAEYQTAFHAIHQDLKKGRAYQVNYSQPFIAHFQGDPWLMYQQISRKNPVPYAAFLRTSSADILSFSPERFLLMDKQSVLTSPIKGTAYRSLDAEKDNLLRDKLKNCCKNQAENVMIVDLLRNDLGKIAEPGSVTVSALCALESYQSVHHLVSHIEAICRNDKTLMDVFDCCFPGGSITGAPKLEAMRIIAEQEAYARSIYCGCIGYFSQHGRFDSNIAIRTVIAQNETLHLAAGGGIVIDSHWKDEYLECFTKIAAIVHGIE